MDRRQVLGLISGAILGSAESFDALARHRHRRRRRRNHNNNNQTVTVPITIPITVPPSPGVPPPPPDPPCVAPCVVATNVLGARVCVQNSGGSKGSCNACKPGEQCIPASSKVVCAATC